METTTQAKRCPDCGSRLDRCEDPTGVSWQCHEPSCRSTFEDDEDLDDYQEEAASLHTHADQQRAFATAPDGGHFYLSTSCYHGTDPATGEDLHRHCQGKTNHSGAPKQAGTCKFCPAQCVCRCHAEPVAA